MKKRKLEISTSSSMLGQRRGKGAANLEFVLSFVIFVIFLVFLYNALDPIIKTAGSKQFILGHVKLALLENLTLSDFTIKTFTLEINVEDIEEECIRVQEGNLFDLISVDQEALTIKNEDGKILNYTFRGGSNLLIPTEDFTRLIKVYFATDFLNRSPEYEDPPGGGTCFQLTEENYDLRTVTEKEIISETNVDTIQAAYEDSYENLKDILGIPSGSDFVIGFVGFKETAGGEIIWPSNYKEPPQNVNVYVGEFPIQYLDEEATIKIGFLVIKVW